MLSIPEIATQLVDKSLSQVEGDNAHTLFIVGSKRSGKSTLLSSFLDKTEPPRETLVLEYSFGRKSNQKQGIEKTICHVWEYGGKLETLKNVLPSIPVSGKYYYCVMVDLSKIKLIWETIETCVEIMKESYPELRQLPELMIIGGKYDIFKNYDSEIKKFICTSIRGIALLYNAHVLFYSSKDVPLVRKTREILQNACFGSCINLKEKNTNFAKPLAIPRGSDTWESIGTSSFTFEQLKMRHLARIPPDVLSTETNNITSTQQAATHPEPSLQKLIALKYEELRNIETLDICIDDYLLDVNK